MTYGEAEKACGMKRGVVLTLASRKEMIWLKGYRLQQRVSGKNNLARSFMYTYLHVTH